ncbi:MAG: hypothetical protein RMI45_00995 [Ignisphaera sp.]|nr:hypothetical protein [Ignisphaera sp.]MDW8084803.1 hypothetical protein [Ignisphaera sp.]
MGCGQQELRRGVAAVIGSVVLISIFIASAAFIIITLEKFSSLAIEASNLIVERSDRMLVLHGIESWWSYNGSTITIYIDNKMARAALLTAIAIVYSDGSFETISWINRTVEKAVASYHVVGLHSSLANQLRLPYLLPPATATVINISSTKTPLAISIASMVTSNSIVVPSRKNQASRSCSCWEGSYTTLSLRSSIDVRSIDH